MIQILFLIAGKEVLDDTPDMAFTECFTGDKQWSACETCGYYENVENSNGAYNCITCPVGYEIEVYFGDCTGFCTASRTVTPEETIEASECNPISDCVLD
jgi:hypothetical protein